MSIQEGLNSKEMAQLPESERFARLAPAGKQLMDTIETIAYRAETAMATALCEENSLARADDARPLLREIFMTEADLISNEEQQTWTVQLHHLTNHMLRLVYKLASDPDPPDQEFSAFSIFRPRAINRPRCFSRLPRRCSRGIGRFSIERTKRLPLFPLAETAGGSPER
jgi:hypothetical protein